MYDINTDHKLYKNSSANMNFVKDSCIHMVITSPPYNEGKEYDPDDPESDMMSWKEYIAMAYNVFREAYRVLVDGGKLAVNIANLGRYNEKKHTFYKPLRTLYEEILLSIGFIHQGEIIWWKGDAANVGTTWGSYRLPSNPAIRDTHEYVLIFKKKGMRSIPDNNKYQIDKHRFLELTKSVWKIPAVSNTKHPCTFPDGLVDNLLTLFTFPDDMVLDPFGGSGTVARVARQLERKSITFEIVPRFQNMIELEISKTFIQDWFGEL